MKTANIVPPMWVNIFSKGYYRMALAHWVAGYPRYATDISSSRAFVLMDNGAFEDEQMSVSGLLMAGNLLQADEIALPDVLGNSKLTFERSLEALPLLRCFNLMFIPQGTSVTEWKRCLESFIKFVGEDLRFTIGVTSLRDKEGILLPKSKIDLLKQALTTGYQVHILGISDIALFANELCPLAIVGGVRGVDSSIAFVLGSKGILLTPNSPKYRLGDPNSYDKLSDKRRRLVELNMAILEYWCSGGRVEEIPEGLIRKQASNYLKYWSRGLAQIEEAMKAVGFPPGNYDYVGDAVIPLQEGKRAIGKRIVI